MNQMDFEMVKETEQLSIPSKFRRRIAKVKSNWTKAERERRAEVGARRREELYQLLFGAQQILEPVA